MYVCWIWSNRSQEKEYKMKNITVILTLAAVLYSPVSSAKDNEEKNETSSQENEKKEDGEKKERKKEVRFPFFTVGIHGGLLMLGDMMLSTDDYTGTEQNLTITQRGGAIVKLPINLLGDGLGIEITPFLSGERTGDDGIEKITSVGGQLGFAYRFRIRRFYPKIGIGGHIAYLGGDDINHGIEAYGRIPIGFTWYFARFMALEVEVAAMVGATGIRTNGTGVFSNRMYYDTTGGLEFAVGFRFP